MCGMNVSPYQLSSVFSPCVGITGAEPTPRCERSTQHGDTWSTPTFLPWSMLNKNACLWRPPNTTVELRVLWRSFAYKCGCEIELQPFEVCASSSWQKQSRACHTAGVGKTRVSDGGDGINASRHVLGRMDGDCTSHARGGAPILRPTDVLFRADHATQESAIEITTAALDAGVASNDCAESSKLDTLREYQDLVPALPYQDNSYFPGVFTCVATLM